ncbi:hypothetical protein [Paenibacillus sinopodophylli]|uniref:hypothetical protein n=1 Tax=Paenibacillus sinopodophylli TaxID=1837342 RepID=UPI00110D1603|nr:hypothetical protein [Paenibacillus sinopodophylli]
MKKTKQPGDNISLKTKKTEDPLVMQWLNTQSNLMDSLRYLVEREIASHGVRNLQAFVPMERSMLHSGEPLLQQDADLRTQLASGLGQLAAAAEEIIAPPKVQEPAAEEEFDDDDIEAWS